MQGAPAATVVTSADLASVVTAITAQVSVSTVIEILAYCATTCIALVFMWWGVRKVTRMIMSAFKRGKLSV